MFGARYLLAYIVGSTAGILNEFFQKPDQPCFLAPRKSCMLTWGGANVYGWSVLALTAFFDVAVSFNVPTIFTILAIGPLLAALECAFGKVSKKVFGPPQRWKYPDHYCTACEGYISVLSTLYFEVLGIVYWYGLYKPVLSKI